LLLVLEAILGRRAEPVAVDEPTERRRRRRRSARTALAGTAVVALAVIAVLALGLSVARARDDIHAASELRCNGFADLCDRRLDQLAFAGSHNSMSAAADPGWLFAENLTGIADQLDYGIRALLVKTHYGLPTGVELDGTDMIVTDIAAEAAVNPNA